jgi:ABC-type bacteriocin/lantibiotic exporter with double-glycine peptidase domain
MIFSSPPTNYFGNIDFSNNSKMPGCLSLFFLSHCYKILWTNSAQKQKVSKMTDPVWRTRASLLTLYFLSCFFSSSSLIDILSSSILSNSVTIDPIASLVVRMILYSLVFVIKSLKIVECKSYCVESFRVSYSC